MLKRDTKFYFSVGTLPFSGTPKSKKIKRPAFAVVCHSRGGGNPVLNYILMTRQRKFFRKPTKLKNLLLPAS
ncbi:hypothetical protein COT02_01775 [Candidatus Roizmanbacteria bacterium CG07_land_8_20_14_0_80_34_15]|uniref:Uncharacterized protein n=1 Tax=Candidatus Roizmanbacteria bacterium CG07_land_8_20_14_0_80_34_15 TaxID=1974849 RepID=A0A2M6YV30_9BACT|nr:MAG: hypothetical protein COT02_01775 [Candidatus Roizmanbacteria bacterium CG07_land_8_20_14_0_80_34_15]